MSINGRDLDHGHLDADAPELAALIQELAANALAIKEAAAREASETLHRAYEAADEARRAADEYVREQRELADRTTREAEAFAENAIDDMLASAQARIAEMEARRRELEHQLAEASTELEHVRDLVQRVPDLGIELGAALRRRRADQEEQGTADASAGVPQSAEVAATEEDVAGHALGVARVRWTDAAQSASPAQDSARFHADLWRDLEDGR